MTHLSVSDQDYFAHIFMTSNSKHSFLSDNDWIYDSEVFQTMIKMMNHYIEYIFLSKSLIFRNVTDELCMTYDVETVQIWMKYRNVFIKKIYYTFKIVINLFCMHDLLIFNYWIKLQQDYFLKIIEQKTDDLIDFITILNWKYIICTQKFQTEKSQIESFKIERFILAAIFNNFLHFWHLWLDYAHYQAISKIIKISMSKIKLLSCWSCLAEKQTE